MSSVLLHNIPIWIMLFTCHLSLQAQYNNQITELEIVKDPIEQNVVINGEVTSIYQMQGLDSEPVYPGGLNALMVFLSENLNYPSSAMDNGIQGRVVVKFVVTKEGRVTNVEVVESVDPSLDAEALRVISLLKGFNPGVYDGKKVDVWYTLPVSFKL